jgi:hypothetical protein
MTGHGFQNQARAQSSNLPLRLKKSFVRKTSYCLLLIPISKNPSGAKAEITRRPKAASGSRQSPRG